MINRLALSCVIKLHF